MLNRSFPPVFAVAIALLAALGACQSTKSGLNQSFKAVMPIDGEIVFSDQ